MNEPASPGRSEHAAWRSGRLVVMFCVVAAVLLAGDLATKWWAFNVFPDQPIDIHATLEQARQLQAEHGGSLVEHVHLPRISKPIVPHGLTLRLVLNLGAVFGMGQGKTWLFVAITIAAVGIIGYSFATTDRRQRFTQIMLAMVLAGALGNLYDRIFHGAVRDMLHMFPGVNLPFGWTWPEGNPELYPWVFNLADVYLTVGIAMIVIHTLWPRHNSSPT